MDRGLQQVKFLCQVRRTDPQTTAGSRVISSLVNVAPGLNHQELNPCFPGQSIMLHFTQNHGRSMGISLTSFLDHNLFRTVARALRISPLHLAVLRKALPPLISPCCRHPSDPPQGMGSDG